MTTHVVFADHTGEVAGAQESLLGFIQAAGGRIAPVVACPDGPLADRVRSLGIEVIHVPGVPLSFRTSDRQALVGLTGLIKTALKIRRHVSGRRVDLLHANSVRAGLATGLASRLGAPPTLVLVHDLLPSTLSGRLVAKTIVGSAAAVAAVSDQAMVPFRRATCRRVIHDGVDLQRFDPRSLTKDEARARLPLPDDGPLLGVVGYFSFVKGQADAVEMLAHLDAEFPRARLVFAGEVTFAVSGRGLDNQGYFELVRRRCRELGLSERVHFLGHHDDVPVLMRALDLLLVPSRQEAFGRAAVEAMAMKTPVVSTDRGGPEDVLVDGRHGRLLAPGDPRRWASEIANLLRSPELRERMGRAGRRRAEERFSVEASTKSTLDLYGTLGGHR